MPLCHSFLGFLRKAVMAMDSFTGEHSHRNFLFDEGMQRRTIFPVRDQSICREKLIKETAHLTRSEVLIRMLPSYYRHMCLYENSLVTKFFGVHCMKPFGGQKVHFIIMGNCSAQSIESIGNSTSKARPMAAKLTRLREKSMKPPLSRTLISISCFACKDHFF